jgi:hypothetical protein
LYKWRHSEKSSWASKETQKLRKKIKRVTRTEGRKNIENQYLSPPSDFSSIATASPLCGLCSLRRLNSSLINLLLSKKLLFVWSVFPLFVNFIVQMISARISSNMNYFVHSLQMPENFETKRTLFCSI